MRGAISSEEYKVWVEPGMFKDLFLIGEITQEQKEEIWKRATEDMHLNKLYKTETALLQAFKKYMQAFVVQLNDVISDRIDELAAVKEAEKDKFIDSFKEYETISQNKIAELANMSKNTIANPMYAANYASTDTNGRTVIHTKQFLKWLKVSKPKQYELFKKNWLEKKED